MAALSTIATIGALGLGAAGAAKQAKQAKEQARAQAQAMREAAEQTRRQAQAVADQNVQQIQLEKQREQVAASVAAQQEANLKDDKPEVALGTEAAQTSRRSRKAYRSSAAIQI